MKVAHRKLLISFLVLAFVVQTLLVYTDSVASSTPGFDQIALRGRALWHQNNCNACHQLYGFGGFLGPDLTNAMSRVNRKRLDSILTDGFGQMPAFHFDAEQIDAIQAFLEVLDRTGRGQARRARSLDRETIASAVLGRAETQPMSEAAERGWERFRGICSSCHVLFRATPLGPFSAPDLSDVTARLSEEEIHTVLENGRVERGMPPSGLAEPDRNELLDWFRWLERNRLSIQQDGAVGGGGDQGLPWFEFK